MKKSIVKNYLYNMLYQILVLITPIITTPYISRVLGAKGIGIFSYSQSIAAYFVLFGTLGSSLYGQREIAYVQDNKTKRSNTFVEINIIRAIAVLASIVIYWLRFVKSGDNTLIYKILTLEIISAALDISWFFQGLEDFKKIFVRNFAIKIISILSIFLFVKKQSDLPLYALCYVLPVLLGNLSLWPAAFKLLQKGSSYNFLRHIKPLLIFFIPQIATEVYTVLDKTMIGILANSIEEVGYYTQAQKMVKMTLCVVSSLGTVMLSAMSREFQKQNYKVIIDSVLKSYRFVFYIGMPMTFGIIGISRNFVPWFFGKGYESVKLIMAALAPIIVIIGMSNVTGRQFLLPTKRQKAFTISVFCGAGLNFVFNLFLIPIFNAMGAVIGTLIAEIGVTTIQLICIKNQIPLGRIFRLSIPYLLFSLVMMIPVTLIGEFMNSSPITFLIQLVVGGCVYLGLLILFKDEMTKQAIEAIKNKFVKS